MAEEAELDKLLVIMEADTVVGPHAVVIHQEDTLVANGAVMGPQRLEELALLAVDAFRLGEDLHETF